MVKTTDKVLLLICICLSGISCLMMVSIVYQGFEEQRTFIVQLVSVFIGIIAAIGISFLDYRIVARMWPVYTFLVLLLLLLVRFSPLGYQVPGSDNKAWLQIGPILFQPSELLKLAFIYTFSLHLSRVKERINYLSTFLLLCLHGAVPTMLIVLLQKDYGSALVFVAIFIVMLFSAGLSWKLFAIGIGATALISPIVWIYLVPDYIKTRFEVAWSPQIDKAGAGMQQYKGRIALGSGKLTGRGLFTDGLYNFPARHNDMIFAYIGQTLGFVGCMIVAIGLVVLMTKILFVGKKAVDDEGRFICVGVFAVLFFQSIINIGLVLCVIPVIGVTLPFVSAGGSSALVSYMAIGMVLGVHRQYANQTLYENK